MAESPPPSDGAAPAPHMAKAAPCELQAELPSTEAAVAAAADTSLAAMAPKEFPIAPSQKLVEHSNGKYQMVTGTTVTEIPKEQFDALLSTHKAGSLSPRCPV